jgi:hypothetical protein
MATNIDSGRPLAPSALRGLPPFPTDYGDRRARADPDDRHQEHGWRSRPDPCIDDHCDGEGFGVTRVIDERVIDDEC